MGLLLEKVIQCLEKCKILSPKSVCFTRYFLKFRKWPDMKNPQTINEKLLWLEFYSDTSKWADLSDKYRVREYLKEKGLEHLLVKLYGIYTDANDIDFEQLPDSFVIKTNNGCGTVNLVKDKNTLDIPKLKSILNKWLKKPYGYLTGEPHYTKIKPCIIIEEMLPLPMGGVNL